MKASELIRILQTLNSDDHISLNMGDLRVVPDSATIRDHDAWARQFHKDSDAANKKKPAVEDIEGVFEDATSGELRVFFPGETMWIRPVHKSKNGGSGVLLSVPTTTNGWRTAKHDFHPGHGAHAGDHVAWVWSLYEGEKVRQFSTVLPHTAKSTEVAETLFAAQEKADKKAAKAK